MRKGARRNGLFGGVWCLALAGLILAGCSSSSKNSQTTSPPSTAAAGASNSTAPNSTASNSTGSVGSAGGAAPTGTPIVIGSVSDITGSPGVTGELTVWPDIWSAWTKWTNAHGGINGHPVKVIDLDAGADPAQATSAVHTLIQQDHVVAIVGHTSASTLPAWDSYVVGAGIPIIGGQNYQYDYFQKPLMYSPYTTNPTETYGQAFSAKNAGVTKIGILLCTETPSCANSAKVTGEQATSLGIDVVFNGLASFTQPSYTAQCLKMKQGGANGVLAFVNDQTLAADCSRQGLHPTYLGADMSITPAQLQATPEFNGLTGPSQVFDVYSRLSNQQPAAQPFFDALQQYAPQYLAGGGKFGQLSQPAGMLWVSAEAFAQAMKNVAIPASQTVTTADVIKGLSMFKNETLGGLTEPFTFGPASAPQPQVKCFFIYKVANSQYALPYGLKTFCQP